MTESSTDLTGNGHRHGSSISSPPHRSDATIATARTIAYLLLAPLPARWAHSATVAAQADEIASTVASSDRGLLVSAAWLHDIGYSPLLIDSGFHPLDGALHLIRAGAPMRLAALVAHHSEARLLAQPRGLLDALDEFPREDGSVTDALAYADMTAGPTGEIMSVARRFADIRERHADEPPDLFAARRRREPQLLAATARAARRLRGCGPQTYVPESARDLTYAGSAAIHGTTIRGTTGDSTTGDSTTGRANL
ncbi:HD domain-containing protein [Frankia sp. Cas4]|uniref:HD domain-containing protein n=1 Tax=Frankia sp. Cas4 TaxID=3073927 RepID=UPI002AD45139|nr:HD domain-containing protein [Frankia sp. Cas4]